MTDTKSASTNNFYGDIIINLQLFMHT